VYSLEDIDIQKAFFMPYYLGLCCTDVMRDHCFRSQWPRGLRRSPWSLGRWDRGFESRL